MSEREIRQILQDVIRDIDSGRVRVARRPPRGWRHTVGSAMLATALGMGGAGLASGCDSRSVGSTVDSGPDATARVDAGIAPAYGEPFLDAGPVVDYGEPFYDAGTQPAYAEPFYDAGANEDYGVPPVWDAGTFTDAGGNVPAYGVPPVWDAGTFTDAGGNVPAYGVPFCPPVPKDPEE